MPNYYALFHDRKTVTKKTSLELINEIKEPILYLIKEEVDGTRYIWGGEFNLYAYTVIDLEGKAKPIELTDFILVDIGTDDLTKEGIFRQLTFKEKLTGELRQITSHTKYREPLDFIKGELLYHLDRLEEARSFQAYDLHLEINELKAKNEQLEARIKKLTEAS